MNTSSSLQSQDKRPYVLGPKRVLQFIALAFAIAAVCFLLALPGYVQMTVDSSGNESMTTPTLIDIHGIIYMAVLAIPVGLAIVPLFLKGRAWRIGSIVCSVLLAIFALLGSLSIGVYFVPAAVVAVIAALMPIGKQTG